MGSLTVLCCIVIVIYCSEPNDFKDLNFYQLSKPNPTFLFYFLFGFSEGTLRLTLSATFSNALHRVFKHNIETVPKVGKQSASS